MSIHLPPPPHLTLTLTVDVEQGSGTELTSPFHAMVEHKGDEGVAMVTVVEVEGFHQGKSKGRPQYAATLD